MRTEQALFPRRPERDGPMTRNFQPVLSVADFPLEGKRANGVIQFAQERRFVGDPARSHPALFHSVRPLAA